MEENYLSERVLFLHIDYAYKVYSKSFKQNSFTQ